MDVFVKKLKDKWIEYPLKTELIFQHFENETGLSREEICDKLGIKKPDEYASTDVVTTYDKRYRSKV